LKIHFTDNRVYEDLTVVVSELTWRISMPLNEASLSNHEKTVLLAGLAYALTICARDTYEVGTDRVTQPELLRAYNELLHRVTGATRDHLLRSEAYSLKDVVEMLEDFGEKNGRAGEIQWALKQATKSL
jgi:hypothetical protein